MPSSYVVLHLNPWPENPPLRKWQERFLERWILLCDPTAGGQKNFLMAVVPAAGKTTASIKAAHEGMRRKWFGRIVVVVPSRNLVGQWIKSANEKGINLQEVEDYGVGITTPSDSAGIVTTYHAVAKNPDRFRTYSSRTTTLVIGDEIHHCGEQENLAWGQGMLVAFDHEMTMRLTSSGTPFRSDRATIPFVQYDQKKTERDDGVIEYIHEARADFEYSYGEALRDGVVRDIFFPTWDCNMTWLRGGQQYTHTFQDDLDEQLSSDRLKSALNPEGEWLKEVIRNAHDRLITIREEEGHPNAGGLVICKDQEHANLVATLVKDITRTTPVIVHSDIPTASQQIDEFAASYIPWIVTVRMVSEGVDIKRLRVGIYATNYKTRLYFLQAIARTTRYDSSVPGLSRDGDPVGQPAWFYVPDDPDLQAYMAQIMEISLHQISEELIEDDENGLARTASGQTTFLDGYEFVDGRDPIETGHFYEAKKWTPEQMERANAIFNGIPAFDHVPDAAKALAVERMVAQIQPAIRDVVKREVTQPVAQTQKPMLPYQEERSRLKQACNSQTKKLTYMLLKTHPLRDNFNRVVHDYSRAIAIVSSKLNAYFGARNIGDGSNDDLNQRRELLAEWIHQINNGGWDPKNLGF